VKTTLALIAAMLPAGLAWAQGPSGAARPGAARAAVAPSAVTPWARGETLNYSGNWPSGLSLGEATFKTGGAEPGWQFEFTIEAGLPGLEIRDTYRSTVNASFCSERLEKDFVHGPRKGKETVTYDLFKRQATRQTTGGGKSEISTSDCVKDGLAFVYFLRRELAGGRVPASQQINFGAAYQVTATYADSPQIEVGGARQASDRVQVSLKGSVSSHTLEIFFARDAARTPLLVRMPFALGTFALELVR